MTQEEKQLLLVDLSARLPYKCKYKASKGITHWHKLTLSTVTIDKIIDDYYDEIKPYLRPMSSITDEEKEELKNISARYIDEWENTKTPEEKWALGAKTSYINAEFYNSHHLDWNGLIEKGLAIAVTEDNNPYKT